MSAKPDGGPAFPFSFRGEDGNGMSLRDWFAGQALAGFVLAHCVATGPLMSHAEIAQSALALADAMLLQGGEK